MTPEAQKRLLQYQAEQKARIRQARATELESRLQDMTYKERVEFLFPDLNNKFHNNIAKGCPFICVV